MKRAIVVTSINSPNAVLSDIAKGSRESDFAFIVIGDTKSPTDFHLDGCEFLAIKDQLATKLSFAQKCPTRHYARKNIGYLLAVSKGAEVIVETDDDNFPRKSFFAPRSRQIQAAYSAGKGWVNVYGYFSSEKIWPRGLPLDQLQKPIDAFDSLPVVSRDCPIQQGLADENPDVDAIYRLILPLPQNFRQDRQIILGAGSWCPFNSQNTTWWADAFPLLYLPAYCSFRMTDIWRSFVAQRIAWENNWGVLFHGPTVWQDRNEHSLMRDFADEVPGYLNNDRIRSALDKLSLQKGSEYLCSNLRRCYEVLVALELVGGEELSLLDAWTRDLHQLGYPTS